MTQNTFVNIKSLYSEHVKDLQTYIMFRIKQKMVDLTPELKRKNRSPLNLSIGAPTQPPPTIVTEEIKKALSEPQIDMYSTPTGELYFLEAAASRVKNRFNVTIDPKTQICALIGSKEGLTNLFRGFITPQINIKDRDIIMIPDPGYASYQESIKVIGGYAYPIALTPENNYMPDPEKALEQLIKDGYDPKKVKMFIVNYPSNPIGALANLDYYQKIVDFGLKHNILICSDAAYTDMAFGNETPPSILQAKNAMDIAIEFHSLSKPYSMTGWRIGFAIGNTDAIGILRKVKSTTDTGIFKAIQRAASIALTDSTCEDYIKENNRILKHRQEFMIEDFKKLGWPIKEENIPKATFYLWLPIPPKYKTSEEFTNDLLAKSGVVAVPGSAFGNYGDRYFRISLVLPDDQLKQIYQRLSEDGFYYNK